MTLTELVIASEAEKKGRSFRAEWRPVLGFEGVYEVSAAGHVRRVAGGYGAKRGRILGQHHSGDGYGAARVALTRGRGAQHRQTTWRAVAELVQEAWPSSGEDR